MKKLMSLLCLATLVMVSGCSDASADITDGSTMIMQIGNKKITKDDIYSIEKTNAGSSMTLSLITTAILDKEVEVTDAITKEAKSNLADSKKSAGDNFETQLKQYGYKDEDDFYNRASLTTVRKNELAKKYIDEQDKLSSYHPVKAQIFATKDEAKAKEAISKIKDGSISYSDAVSQYGDDSTYKGTEAIYHSDSGVPSNVWQSITNAEKAGLIDTAISGDISKTGTDGTSTTETKYYVVNLTNTDTDKFKKDAIKKIVEDSSSVVDEAFKFYLKKYEFTVWDIDVYDGLKASNPTYLIQDSE